jgi:hypothetical protein
MKRHVLLRRLMEFDSRLDAQIFGVETPTPREPVESRMKEFALFPAVAGATVGSAVGSQLSGKKKLADGSWVDENGQPTTAPVIAPVAGGLVGGAAGVGASKLHSSIMSNYGGEGGAGQAYGNLGRNIVQGAKSGVADRMAAASAGAATGRTVGTDIGMKAGAGIANVLEKLKKLKGAGVGALGKVFSSNRMPRELVEFEDRLDAIMFKKKEPTEFAGGYTTNKHGAIEKEPGFKAHLKRHAGVYVGSTVGLPTFPVGTGIGALIDMIRRNKNVTKTLAQGHHHESSASPQKKQTKMSDARKQITFDRKPTQLPNTNDVHHPARAAKIATGGLLAGLGIASAARLPSRARLMATSAKHGLRTGWAARGVTEKFRRAIA